MKSKNVTTLTVLIVNLFSNDSRMIAKVFLNNGNKIEH